MQYILLILCLIQLAAIVWLVMQVQKLRRPQDDTALRTLRQEIAADTQNQMQMLGNLLSENQRQSGDYQAERLEQMERGMDARLRQFESRVGNLERSNAQGMEQIRSAVAANLHRMQTQQQDSLAEIQSTVAEPEDRAVLPAGQQPPGTSLPGAGRNADAGGRRGGLEKGAVQRQDPWYPG